MTLVKVENDRDLSMLSLVADEVWHEYFPCILSEEQIDYMVEKFQSYEAMKSQINEGYEYYFIMSDEAVAGYMGIHEEKEHKRMFLSKLYLKKEFRGKGLAGKALCQLKDMAETRGLDYIWLTVNRHNDHTIKIYEHMGFAKARTLVTDIGNGYVMDDYVMENYLA